MYREQNYIFSFTFVYKSKTACLIKHLLKKKEKEKKKTSTHTHTHELCSENKGEAVR